MNANKDKKETDVDCLYRIRVSEPEVLIKDFESIRPEILHKNRGNLLLGNGFNMSVDADTSGHQLGKTLAKTPEVAKALSDAELKELNGEPGFDIEDFASDLSGEKLKIVRTGLFNLINDARCSEAKEARVLDFLEQFNLVFTTNYDAVLYRLMISIYQRNNRYSKGNDGFGRYKKSGRLEWHGTNQNYFYLHGAFHIYMEGLDVCKRETEEGCDLSQTLRKYTDDHIGIFQSRDKYDEIRKNMYLLICYRTLQRLSGKLCVIGWRCASKDDHLAKAIRESPANPIYVSVHFHPETIRKQSGNYLSLSNDKEAWETIRNFRYHLYNKDLVFFDVNTVDYLKGAK